MSYESVKVVGRDDRIKELIEASKAVGHRRAVVEKAFAEIRADFAFTVSFGGDYAQMTALGADYVDQAIAPTEDEMDHVEAQEFNKHGKNKVVRMPRDARNPGLVSQLPGAAWANKKIGNLIIPCGVVLIVGPGGVGKSPIAHEMAAFGREAYGVVRVGEPLAGYTSSDMQAASSLGQALCAHSDVVLDSIKDLLAGAGGSAMKSGLSREALRIISSWSMLAADLGATIYVPVNPSTRDDDVHKMLAEIARSNATMMMDHRGGDQWAYSIRRGEGLKREEGMITVSWRNNRPTFAGITASASGDVGNGSADLVIQARPSSEAVGRTVSRLISASDKY